VVDFFQPRNLKLQRIANETQINCLIYSSAVYLDLHTTAYICSINAINGSYIHGSLTNIVKVNQAWIDMDDRLQWCRFQVVNINAITPILQIDRSFNFRCTSTNINSDSMFSPLLTFFNHDISTEDETCTF